MSDFLGIAAVIASLTCVTLGVPMQIYKNFQKKGCEGLSLSLTITSFFTYSSWALYGKFKPDNFLLYSQIPGAVLMIIIIMQFFIYRRKNGPKISF